MLSPGTDGITPGERIERGERTAHDQALGSGQGREDSTEPKRQWPEVWSNVDAREGGTLLPGLFSPLDTSVSVM